MTSWGHIHKGAWGDGYTLAEILTYDVRCGHLGLWHGYIVSKRPRLSYSNREHLV